MTVRQKELCEKLEQTDGRPLRSVVGLDGFVDEVVHVVDKRYSPTEFDRILTLRAYGNRISDSSGLSSNVEIVTIDKKLGGNGPIFALGLKKFCADITYIGCVGADSHDAVFAELVNGSRVIGICEPGRTDAMEFEDGKLIRSKIDMFNNMTWQNILKKIPEEEFARLLDEARLLSFNNWTMINAMSDIWKHILKDILPLMKSPLEEKILFFDIADPEKREEKDITEALSLIREFNNSGFHTILGLNKKEACEIAAIAGTEYSDYAGADLKELTERVAGYLSIECVVVHPADRAACVKDGLYHEVEGPYCARPNLTTGAGDNFNAGFVYGYAMSLDMDLCLLLGTATSGFYVRERGNPTLPEVREFLGKWGAGLLDQ